MKMVTKKLKKKIPTKKIASQFYDLSFSVKADNLFNIEFNILLKTIETVNNFHLLYKKERSGTTGSPTHTQQDLFRAMLVFSCAGLDAVVKQLVKTKLAKLVGTDKTAKSKFKDYVKSGLAKFNK